MYDEPKAKRCIAFIDAQSLFYSAREAFGSYYPDFDPMKLAKEVCRDLDCELVQTRVYTSVPSHEENPYWHRFWRNKIRAMEEQGVITFWSIRPNRRSENPQDEMEIPKSLAFINNKTISVKMGIDIVQRANNKAYDVALVFSKDLALSEAASEIRNVAREQERWIRICSAFPYSTATRSFRGIDRTDWIQLDRELYDSCLDPNDYRSTRVLTKNDISSMIKE